MMVVQCLFKLCLLIGLCLPISPLLTEQKNETKSVEFFVVIPSYNNSKWCKRNLESVFSQTYQNWTLVYIDDCSTDNTGALADAYVHARGMDHKCTVIHNNERRGAMANLYSAIMESAPDKVVIDLDGDDFLSDNSVFQTLADVYKDPNIWLTYGSYQYEPGGQRGVCEMLPEDVLKNASVRSYNRWVTSQLRTFYAGLFHKIRKEDLMVNGKFFQISSDVALFIPMIEMASPNHIRYIDQILYIYNYTNPISDSNRRNLQVITDLYIRSLKPYDPLEQLFSEEDKCEQLENKAA